MDNFNPEDSDVYIRPGRGASANLAGFMGSKESHMYIGIDKAFDTNGTHSLEGKRLYMSLDTMVTAWEMSIVIMKPKMEEVIRCSAHLMLMGVLRGTLVNRRPVC